MHSVVRLKQVIIFHEPITYLDNLIKFILYVQSQNRNNVSNLGGFTETDGYFCHPNTNMSAININEAKEECLTDQSCDMFYRVCNYSEFRKCNNTGKAEYEEKSTCGTSLGHSSLYKRGNIIYIRTHTHI